MNSNKDFFTNLLISLFLYIGVILLLVFLFTIFSSAETTTNPSDTSNKSKGSEYRDALESKNYNPNSEGGERCFGQICF